MQKFNFSQLIFTSVTKQKNALTESRELQKRITELHAWVANQIFKSFNVTDGDDVPFIYYFETCLSKIQML